MEKNITSADAYKSLGIIKDQLINAIVGFLNDKLTTDSIRLDYFRADGTISYDFLDTDGNGYGKAIHIDYIEREGEDTYNFSMIDEDGDDWGDRELADFNADELAWVLEMLEETFEAIDDYYDGKILTKDYFDYDEMEEDEE